MRLLRDKFLGFDGFQVVLAVEFGLGLLECFFPDLVYFFSNVLECDKLSVDFVLFHSRFLQFSQMVTIAVDLLAIELVQKLRLFLLLYGSALSPLGLKFGETSLLFDAFQHCVKLYDNQKKYSFMGF